MASKIRCDFFVFTHPPTYLTSTSILPLEWPVSTNEWFLEAAKIGSKWKDFCRILSKSKVWFRFSNGNKERKTLIFSALSHLQIQQFKPVTGYFKCCWKCVSTRVLRVFLRKVLESSSKIIRIKSNDHLLNVLIVKQH